MGSESRFEHNHADGTVHIVEWRKIDVDPRYEINRDGLLRRVDTKRIQKDQTKFRYFEGSVRRAISVRKLRNRAWPEVISKPNGRFRESD
jgi:hypothetical protein